MYIRDRFIFIENYNHPVIGVSHPHPQCSNALCSISALVTKLLGSAENWSLAWFHSLKQAAVPSVPHGLQLMAKTRNDQSIVSSNKRGQEREECSGRQLVVTATILSMRDKFAAAGSIASAAL